MDLIPSQQSLSIKIIPIHVCRGDRGVLLNALEPALEIALNTDFERVLR